MPVAGDYAPSPHDFVREQVELFERTDGAEGNTMQGLPIIVLTTVGAKSGKVRKTPLMRVEHDGRYLVVASQGGAPTHPAWYHNIVADPHVQLQDGRERRDYVARELDGAERDEWWTRAVESFAPYADYQVKTDRQIPILLLDPVE